MPVVEAVAVFHAPPEAITRVLLDASLAPAWTAGLEALELVEGVPGEPGCVGHAHYVEGGRRTTLVDVLEEVRPDRYFRSRVSGGGMTAVVETTLEVLGEQWTRVSIRWDGAATTLLGRVLLPLMRGRIARRAEGDLRALGRVVESRADGAG